MFEISFGEILLSGVVALLVLGPERLLTAPRTLGVMIGRAQRFVATIKADLQQQADLVKLNELRNDIEGVVRAFKRPLYRAGHDVCEPLGQSDTVLRTLSEEANTQKGQAADLIQDTLSQDLPGVPPTNREAHPKKGVIQLDLFEDLTKVTPTTLR